MSYVANVNIVADAVLELARAEWYLREKRHMIDPVGHQAPFAAVKPELTRKHEAVEALTRGVLGAADAKTRAAAVKLAFDIAKADKPVDKQRLERTLSGILGVSAPKTDNGMYRNGGCMDPGQARHIDGGDDI